MFGKVTSNTIFSDDVDFTTYGKPLSILKSIIVRLSESSNNVDDNRDDLAIDDDEENDGNVDFTNDSKFWISPTKRNDLGIVLPLYADRTYPNYPHVYNIVDFKDEYLIDFMDIVSKRNTAFEHSVDPSIVWYCLKSFCVYRHLSASSSSSSSSSSVSTFDRSEIIAKAFGSFLFCNIIQNNRIEAETFKEREILEKPIASSTSRVDILEERDCLNFLIANVTLNNFLTHTVPSRFEACEYIGYADERDVSLDSLIFSSITTRLFIRDIKSITTEIRMIILDYYKKFVKIGDYVAALPFSFFVPNYVIRKLLSERHSSKTSSSKTQAIARRFMIGFRNVDHLGVDRLKQKFENATPNHRYLDLKLHLYLSTRHSSFDEQNLPIDVPSALKSLGFAPFDILHNLQFTREARIAINLDTVQCQTENFQKIREEASEFFSVDDETYEYFSKTLMPPVSFQKITNDDTHRDSRVDTDYRREKSLECVVCLNRIADTVFLACLHKVCCSRCARRVKNCPVCRDAIFARINNYKNLYDEIQSYALIETYSMFEKLIKR